ncbi:NAD-dependent epimerase/dehydratase family protein [candidate division KSB1 bacterium]|nr:NAD-dependent epimerase/dehydratase family protein [candidate division KSB1 bacterium]
MKVLVTGGGGFIGKALCRALLELGYYVTSLGRGDYPELRRLGVRVIMGDIADTKIVKAACTEADVVFHTAAKVGVWGRYVDFYRTNVTGTQNVITACLDCGVGTLVFTSSASVVFGGRDICGGNEDLPYPLRPMSFYTATKARAEQAVLNANSPRLKTVSLRPHLVWGPGDPHIVPRLVTRARQGRLRKIGRRTHLIDTTYIDNIINAHLCAVKAIKKKSDTSGRAYFITNGEPIPVWDFVNLVLAAADVAPVTKVVSPPLALAFAGALEFTYKSLNLKGEPPFVRFVVHEMCSSHWFDIGSAKQYLGYEPAVTVKDGMKRLEEWMRRGK